MGAAIPDYREILAMRKDPARARAMAQFLCTLEDMTWTDWELDFLESISGCQDELSTRQGEKLIELRDASVWYTSVDGFSLRALIDCCHLCRDELREEDASFIDRLKSAGATKLRCKEARRLIRCARAVGEIEPHQGGSLDPSWHETSQPDALARSG